MRIVSFIIVAISLAFLTSCGNKELESRIAKLEGRVAVLEAYSLGGGNPLANQPSAPTKEDQKPETKPEGPLPSIKFEEETYDFGKIKEGDVVKHTFSFVNTGEAPLIISEASATCGCTVPEWPKDPIAVGEKGKIKVEFNSSGKSGAQNKTITLTANTWPTTNQISISAEVEEKK